MQKNALGGGIGAYLIFAVQLAHDCRSTFQRFSQRLQMAGKDRYRTIASEEVDLSISAARNPNLTDINVSFAARRALPEPFKKGGLFHGLMIAPALAWRNRAEVPLCR